MSQQTINFYKMFFENGYYKWIWEGLLGTLGLTVVALIIGLMIGVVVALIQLIEFRKKPGLLNNILYECIRFLKWIARAYIYIIRGTPSTLQVVLMWTVVLANVNWSRIIIGGISLGINSGAYMAELIRAGILGIDKGQMEAGRSLGFNYIQTMRYIILPQAFKQMLPAMVSEFISLTRGASLKISRIKVLNM